jgi:hypothetical protein
VVEILIIELNVISKRLTPRFVFDVPQLRVTEHPVSFKRMRLEWSALYDITQSLPFQLTGYSRAPTSYDEARRLRQLALAAVKPEKHEPVDVASMLVYARNIEALEDLSESPGLWQLLTAASSCLGNEYGRAWRRWRSLTDSILKPKPFPC